MFLASGELIRLFMLFSLLTWESLLPVLTTKTISKSWVTQSRSVHWGFLGIYPSSHVLKDWISWLMDMQAPLILFCLWKHFLTKAVVASLNKTTHPETSSWQLIYFVHVFFFHSKCPSKFHFEFLHTLQFVGSAIYWGRDTVGYL